MRKKLFSFLWLSLFLTLFILQVSNVYAQLGGGGGGGGGGAPPPSGGGGGAVCGNNLKEGTEECDGADLASQTCITKGFTGGTLTCNINCTFNTSQCSLGGGGGGGGGGQPPISGPTITSINPISGFNNASAFQIRLSGSNFSQGLSIKLTKSNEFDISGTNILLTGSNLIEANFNLVNKALGAWQVVVTNSDNKTTSFDSFIINEYPTKSDGQENLPTGPPPIIKEITPDAAENYGQVKRILVIGENFLEGAAVIIVESSKDLNDPSLKYIAPQSATFIDPQHVSGDVFDVTNAPAGKWDIVVLNPDGQLARASNIFTIVESPNTKNHPLTHEKQKPFKDYEDKLQEFLNQNQNSRTGVSRPRQRSYSPNYYGQYNPEINSDYPVFSYPQISLPSTIENSSFEPFNKLSALWQIIKEKTSIWVEKFFSLIRK